MFIRIVSSGKEVMNDREFCILDSSSKFFTVCHIYAQTQRRSQIHTSYFQSRPSPSLERSIEMRLFAKITVGLAGWDGKYGADVVSLPRFESVGYGCGVICQGIRKKCSIMTHVRMAHIAPSVSTLTFRHHLDPSLLF